MRSWYTITICFCLSCYCCCSPHLWSIFSKWHLLGKLQVHAQIKSKISSWMCRHYDTHLSILISLAIVVLNLASCCCLLVYFCLVLLYFMVLHCTELYCTLSPRTLSISSYSLSCISGLTAREWAKPLTVREVVSCPARKNKTPCANNSSLVMAETHRIQQIIKMHI